ncbi:hypothetical protein ACFLZ7_04050 [Nanoarchaeota archaeon]
MQFCKKASLNLSINAIVILILAITMLGLGLGFMKGMFGKVTGQLEKVSEDIESQIIDDIERSGEKLTFLQKKITIKRSETQNVYFGLKNQLYNDTVFYFNFNCYDTLRGSDKATGVSFEAPEGTIRAIKESDVFVSSVNVIARPDAEPTVYSCEAVAAESRITDPEPDEVSGEYSRKPFFITVQ